ncbi:hypothetical protein [Streptomyces alanosinicus]|uniref:Uncharacterized protein n=1 Tax=Streptomyces alanosinicus TaxID=68171 RepID=A0A919D520_9ACTN|nr:hypothetical protein [Streptomyces alanosinicus]GHE08726.1 hypothetical protein GCM10010339_58620 [Streptomyces alanosinicus]
MPGWDREELNAVVDAFAVYRDAMREAWGDWWLAWPLLQKVTVGDVLHESRGAVRAAGTLADRRIAFAETAPEARGAFVYDAGGGIDLRFKASGTTDPLFSALADADAGVLLRFARQRAALVVYRGLTGSGLPDTRALAGMLVRRHWEGRWDAGLLAVTEVVRADAAAVLMAAEAGASVELSLSTSVGAGPLHLLDLAGSARVAGSRHLGFQWIGETLTPLYRVVRLRDTWLGGVREEYGPVQPGRGLDTEPVPPLLLEQAADDPSAVLESPPQPLTVPVPEPVPAPEPDQDAS